MNPKIKVKFKPSKEFGKLMEECYREHSKENSEITRQMSIFLIREEKRLISK